ncbi:thiol reductant ABC exporter subunit CydD [Clavibacter sepedonicus]|uniref:ABC transporter ATP-binding subunit n=1 Tax=Clavibacter sepedonicus TaxID=31964 RepID=B0RDB0_CLASE|nr:thiol reductant ABC exporter subunit CydD [Clavibacter sepedonicus]OQJ47522.1 thiol reductant ABC exporter subunit CydD [Clavibacter sepedonicus]OQJ53078.1 thiol reductant ABC exporter subunit CydD [Clavibacter sepedonicus]UUK64232.1 thiol reductant ABC exporter subunit CydD [Clavibacter sepedonicus]CAQ01866.1 putative ABC transporter ATP-binding subunit [Clavibacter sepedonicus]
MKPLDPRLLRHSASARAMLALGAVVGVVQTLALVAFCWSLTQLVVRAIGGADADALAPELALVIGSAVVRGASAWLLDVVGARGAARVTAELRRRALRAIADLGPAWTAARSRGRLATVVGPGLDALDPYFARYVPQLILTALATPIVVAVLFASDPLTGVTVLVTLPVIPVFMVLVGWATQDVQRRQWSRLTELASGFLDVVDGLSTLLVFGRARRQTARIRRVTEEYRVETMRVLRISFLSGFVLELAASLSVALVAVSVGVRLIGGQLDLGVGLFVLLLAPEAFLPIRQVGVQFHAAAEGVAASDDVLGILEEDRAARASRPVPGGEAATAPAGDALVIRDLAVSRDGRPVLAGIQATFPRGRVTAVTGPSGVGKSSLLAAIRGQLPAEGTIGWSGGAEASAPRPPVPTEIAWAGQRPGLVAGTVRENVALGVADPDDALVRRALALAAAGGIDPDLVLGVGGQGLSGGQAQRVAVARAAHRAMALDCPLVLLDEPSSALDAATEERLAAGIRALADQGRAVVVVTHRGALVRAADAELPLGGGSDADAAPQVPDSRAVAAPPARIAPEPAWRAQVAP